MSILNRAGMQCIRWFLSPTPPEVMPGCQKGTCKLALGLQLINSPVWDQSSQSSHRQGSLSWYRNAQPWCLTAAQRHC